MTPPARTHESSLFLLDGYALIYRAFFAMVNRPLTTSGGENTSAPYGIARFLFRLIEDYEPEYLGVVFDAGDSFRTEVYPEYKATREKMPDELRASLPRCRDIFAAFCVPVIEAEGWEADDVIGSLAKQATAEGFKTVIVSGDKDFHQLIDKDTVLLNPGRGGPAGVDQEWVTEENADKRLGVAPGQVTDFLALLGDASDNVPGVPGIGKKTAPELLREFGNLESLLDRAEEVKATRARNALREHAESARLSKELVTIRTDAPVKLDPDSLKTMPVDHDKAGSIFRELEFHNLLTELEKHGEPLDHFAPDLELIESVSEVANIVASFETAECLTAIAVGSGKDPLSAKLIGLALSDSASRAVYIPLGHEPPKVVRDSDGNPTLALDPPKSQNLPVLSDPAMAPLKTLLESNGPKVGHDLKYTMQLLSRNEVTLGGVDSDTAFDTQVASYCLDPARRDRSMATLAPDRLNTQLVNREEITGTGRNRIGLEEVDSAEMMNWIGPRAAVLHELADVDRKDLERVGVSRLFHEIEMPLIPVLAAMEQEGVMINCQFFAELRARLHRDLHLVREEIAKLAGTEVNLRSVPQLRELLFTKLELPVLKKTKTGPSTDEAVLVQLADMGHEVPRLILEHRELDKLDGTYVSVLPTLVDDKDRIHTRFNQTVAATGRLSSSDPNLQNIPIRRALGRELRKGFIAKQGHLFVGADYSQVELRVMAHLSGDAAFIEAFQSDRDIHRETAAGIFDVASNDVTAGMREKAKTINFATIYGQGPFALAQQLGISYEEATTFIEGYFEQFSGVASYLDEMKDMARRKGYVETLLGRRRYIPEIRSKNPGIRGYGERTAANSPIQGTAADLIKISMIRLHDRLQPLAARMLLQVHDELLIEVSETDVKEVGEILREEMEGAIALDIPLKVDLGVGQNWHDCKFGKES